MFQSQLTIFDTPFNVFPTAEQGTSACLGLEIGGHALQARVMDVMAPCHAFNHVSELTFDTSILRLLYNF